MDSPIVYPTVEIGGKAYTVKLSLGAVVRLERAGFDLRAINDEVRRWRSVRDESGAITQPGQVRLSVVCEILAAALQPHSGMTAEAIADLLELADLRPVFEAVARAVALAYAKLQPPAAVRLQEPGAIQEQAVQ